MGTVDSRKLNAALAKAKNIGLVEQACTIAGCDLVFRSLRSEDYLAVLRDIDGLPEEEYIAKYQKGHIAHAIVEVNGVDLRDSKFVTVEEPDPATGTSRTVTLELHRYLSKHMLDTWGKEAVDIAFRKVGDVLELAERQAKQGITFIAKDETPEEKYRRLLLEVSASEKDLPDSLLDKILEEQGLMRRSTAEEIKRTMQRTDQLAREQEAKALAVEDPEGKAPPADVVTASIPESAAEVPVTPPVGRPEPRGTLQSVIAARKALEVPVVKSEQASESKPPASRSAMIAAIEEGSQAEPDLGGAVSLQSGDPDEVVELRRTPIDAQAASTIVDNPPIAGINPRFRPTQRG